MYTLNTTQLNRFKWKVFFAGIAVGISSLILLFILLFNMVVANSYQTYPPTEPVISPAHVEDDGLHTI
jgi:hypothetical protein